MGFKKTELERKDGFYVIENLKRKNPNCYTIKSQSNYKLIKIDNENSLFSKPTSQIRTRNSSSNSQSFDSNGFGILVNYEFPGKLEGDSDEVEN